MENLLAANKKLPWKFDVITTTEATPKKAVSAKKLPQSWIGEMWLALVIILSVAFTLVTRRQAA